MVIHDGPVKRFGSEKSGYVSRFFYTENLFYASLDRYEYIYNTFIREGF